ncbi:MAG: Clp protease N-terminal domain-containing protein [Mastigocoleus sp.]
MEQFADEAKMTIKLAKEEACRLSHNFVGTESILLGIIAQKKGLAPLLLNSLGITLNNTRIEVEKLIGRGSGSISEDIPFTHRATQVIENSYREANQLQSDRVKTEHLLLALINEGEGICLRILDHLGINSVQIKERLIKQIENQIIKKPANSNTEPQQISKITPLKELTNIDNRIDQLNIMLQDAQKIITEIIDSRNQLSSPIFATSDNIDNVINHLPSISSSEEIDIKDLLKQLKLIIEADERLKSEDKTEALQQILVLAVAARKPTDKNTLSFARTAIKIIIGTVAQRSPSNQLVKECKRLLPIIVQFFNLR